jgi:hypothetical protein
MTILAAVGCGTSKPQLTIALTPNSAALSGNTSVTFRQFAQFQVTRSDGLAPTDATVSSSDDKCFGSGISVVPYNKTVFVVTGCNPGCVGTKTTTLTVTVETAQAQGEVSCTITP